MVFGFPFGFLFFSWFFFFLVFGVFGFGFGVFLVLHKGVLRGGGERIHFGQEIKPPKIHADLGRTHPAKETVETGYYLNASRRYQAVADRFKIMHKAEAKIVNYSSETSMLPAKFWMLSDRHLSNLNSSTMPSNGWSDLLITYKIEIAFIFLPLLSSSERGSSSNSTIKPTSRSSKPRRTRRKHK